MSDGEFSDLRRLVSVLVEEATGNLLRLLHGIQDLQKTTTPRFLSCESVRPSSMAPSCLLSAGIKMAVDDRRDTRALENHRDAPYLRETPKVD